MQIEASTDLAYTRKERLCFFIAAPQIGYSVMTMPRPKRTFRAFPRSSCIRKGWRKLVREIVLLV
jgi:hypothetical protein